MLFSLLQKPGHDWVAGCDVIKGKLSEQCVSCGLYGEGTGLLDVPVRLLLLTFKILLLGKAPVF